ncbi:hypothetical protein ICN35_10060 [Polynucleobacter sp. es-GGE-1]|uniref:hypothetical protein n=1 Tax=Polynucleobacter sp. es-GGE-1 TaxID=1819724 RepID=UPI001C0B9A49|nr:hypothetical protein [Polynucleobacter sp. es-GGE-1]MBU3635805.1 hypothetical protein [Polynucleobacter sp. es-GGE-1]
MTQSNKKTMCNSIDGQIAIFQNLDKGLPTPAMDKAAKPFFDALVLSKAHQEWTPAQLNLAAQVAADSVVINRMRKLIAKDGDVIPNHRGDLNPHPAHKLLDMAIKRVGSNMRLLQLGAIAEIRTLMPARRAEEEARKLIGDDESLLA